MSKQTILVTGATGLVGSKLVPALRRAGHQVRILSRHNRKNDPDTFIWDVDKGEIDDRALEGVDTIIHLAGANVAEGRWTPQRKKEILQSRTLSTRLLFDRLNTQKTRVTNFISASAIGYYGFDRDDKFFVESDSPGNDFLASVTHQWENETDRISALGIRTAKVRIGVVLAREGGALKPVASTVSKLVGAPLGSGKQYMSWIHIDDLVSLFLHLVSSDQLTGAFNAVAPQPVTNAEFTKEVARVLRKPLVLPHVPAFVLKLALGEMADIVLKGSRVSPAKIVNSGFDFKFPDLRAALSDLLH